MGSTAAMIKKLKTNKVMKASELEPFVSSRAQLRRMADAGELIALGSGMYAHPSMDPFTASLVAVARFFPKAVISNITALVVHGLSDERVDRIDVDIPRNSSIRNKLICAHRRPEKNMIGSMRLNYYGHTIRIYSKERTLCEAYHLDPDGPLFLKAIKRYVREGDIEADLIAKYDNALSTNVLRSLRQELADE